MLKFAIIPWSEKDYEDGFFFGQNKKEAKFHNEGVRRFYNVFVNHGDIIHTVDLYKDICEPDYFLFLWPDWKWVMKLMISGLLDRAVYCNGEPPTVIPINCPEGFKKLQQIFPVILTYNSDWVDNKHVFKRNIPYTFTYHTDTIPFIEKKLLTGISTNKKSNYKDELYSERERAYSFFEKKYPDQFAFYGMQWGIKNHPCYGGTVADKFETFHHFKFALCLENTCNVKDYVTEKMLDCLCAGIVPIYGGAINITDYVPQECFIDYFSFSSIQEMADYITGMKENDYQRYLDSARLWLSSDGKLKFTREEYAESIYYAIQNKESFKATSTGKIIVSINYFENLLCSKIVKIRKKVKNAIIKKR